MGESLKNEAIGTELTRNLSHPPSQDCYPTKHEYVATDAEAQDYPNIKPQLQISNSTTK